MKKTTKVLKNVRVLFEAEQPKLLLGTDYSYVKDGDEIILTSGDKRHVVSKAGNNWKCDCEAFKFRHKCKHLDALYADGVIKKPIERRPTSVVDEVIIPAIDPILTKYDPDWKSNIVGSYRRGKSTVKDIDILSPLSKEEFEKMGHELAELPQVFDAPGHTMIGSDIVRLFIDVGEGDPIELDFTRIGEEKNPHAAMLLYRTGPAELNEFMRFIAMGKGYSLSERGLRDHVTGEMIVPADGTEEDIFKALDLKYLTPEQREKHIDYYDIADMKKAGEDLRKLISQESWIDQAVNDITPELAAKITEVENKVFDGTKGGRIKADDRITYRIKPIAQKYAVSPYRSECLEIWKRYKEKQGMHESVENPELKRLLSKFKVDKNGYYHISEDDPIWGYNIEEWGYTLEPTEKKDYFSLTHIE